MLLLALTQKRNSGHRLYHFHILVIAHPGVGVLIFPDEELSAQGSPKDTIKLKKLFELLAHKIFYRKDIHD